MALEIKDIQGNVKLAFEPNTGSLIKRELMGDHYLLLKYTLKTPIDFEVGDYVIYNNGHGESKYELTEKTFPKFNTTTGGYEYELKFNAYYLKWANKKLFYDRQYDGGEASWNLTRTPDAHLSIVCSNLAAMGYDYNGQAITYSIDESVDMSAKLVSYDSVNIIDALTLIAEAWECEWWVEDNVIYLGRCEYNTSIDLELGGNVQNMTRSESQDVHATRLYAFGSTRNLTSDYRASDRPDYQLSIAETRLLLPPGTPYVDAEPNMPQEQAVEAVVVFDDVYPRRIGTMSDITTKEYTTTDEETKEVVETWNAYRYKDAGLNFDLSYRIEDTELRIVFTSGVLNGMDFAVTFDPDGDGSQLWEIVRSEDYGTPVPNDILKPSAGDTYILYNFDVSMVSDLYVPAAEQALLERAQAYLEKSKIDPSVFSVEMNAVKALQDETLNLEMGDRVKLVNRGFFVDGRESRIRGYEKHLDGSKATYSVGNTAAYSRLKEVEGEIKEITYQGNVYTASGGSSVYVIGRNDTTTPTDRNVFSSLRGRAEFLRKTVEDTATALQRFSKGAHFGTFVDSMSAGSGAGIMPDGRAQFESVEVRGSLKVLELIFNRLSATESDFVFTEAGTIESVEQIDDTTYRATIKKRYDNDFVAFKEGDVLRGVVNTLLTTGDYYTSWTRVLSVNTVANTVDLSVYADSEVPAGENHPPMPLMVLHRWGNTFDTTRQSTWYLSSTEGRIVWLDGVTKPILEESNYASFYGKPVHLSIFDNKAINYDQPYLYVRGLAVQDLIRIDYAGNVIREIRDRGAWETSPEEPYRNIDTTQDDVWHVGCRWRCLIDQTTQEPKWNATDWQMIEGNSNLNMVLTSSEGTAFLVGDFATTVTPAVYYGNVDISSDVLSTDWAWTRDTGNVTLDNAWALAHANNGRVLTLTNEDLGAYAAAVGTVMFTCTAYVRDGDIVTPISASLNIE